MKRTADVPACVALLGACALIVSVASGFAAGSRLSGMYGAQGNRSVLHEGDRESVLVAQVAERALLCIVYRDHAAPGLVARWTETAAGRLSHHYAALTEARVL